MFHSSDMESQYPLFAHSQPLGNALELLVELFEAKIDGAVDTARFEYINAYVPESIDEAIYQGIETIKHSWEFQQIGHEGNNFLDKWKMMEAAFDDWDTLDPPIDKVWLQSLLKTCPRAKNSM